MRLDDQAMTSPRTAAAGMGRAYDDAAPQADRSVAPFGQNASDVLDRHAARVGAPHTWIKPLHATTMMKKMG